MKTILILLLFISTKAFSQNLINYSKSEIISSLDANGDNYEVKRTKSGITYISTTNRIVNSIKIYYFDDSNLCYYYLVSYWDGNYSMIVSSLDKYYTRIGNSWYADNSVATLTYNSEYKCYEVAFTRK